MSQAENAILSDHLWGSPRLGFLKVAAMHQRVSVALSFMFQPRMSRTPKLHIDKARRHLEPGCRDSSLSVSIRRAAWEGGSALKPPRLPVGDAPLGNVVHEELASGFPVQNLQCRRNLRGFHLSPPEQTLNFPSKNCFATAIHEEGPQELIAKGAGRVHTSASKSASLNDFLPTPRSRFLSPPLFHHQSRRLVTICQTSSLTITDATTNKKKQGPMQALKTHRTLRQTCFDIRAYVSNNADSSTDLSPFLHSLTPSSVHHSILRSVRPRSCQRSVHEFLQT